MFLDDLTIYVISTGEDTLEKSLRALHAQDCSFKIEHITDVFPMSRAFQEMPHRCRTPYFVQVDADMILEPFAVRTLYEAARKSGFFTAMIFGQLYEEGFGFGGSVRLWKKLLFKYFSFRDCRTVDRDLFKRMRLVGFKRKNVEKVLGIHQPRHSEFSGYLKAKSDIEKWRYLKRNPELYAIKLYDEIVANLPVRTHQFLGILLGSLTKWERYEKSKDLFVEKERYAKILKMLGYAGTLPIIELGEINIGIKKLFVDCYNDFKTTNKNSRTLLAEFIINKFKNSHTSQIELEYFLDVATS